MAAIAYPTAGEAPRRRYVAAMRATLSGRVGRTIPVVARVRPTHSPTVT